VGLTRGAGGVVPGFMEQAKPEAADRPAAAKTAREIRLEREAAALRANLRRRKDQARAREDAGEREGGEDEG